MNFLRRFSQGGETEPPIKDEKPSPPPHPSNLRASFSGGASSLFSSVGAMKNGLFSDISSKLDNVTLKLGKRDSATTSPNHTTSSSGSSPPTSSPNGESLNGGMTENGKPTETIPNGQMSHGQVVSAHVHKTDQDNASLNNYLEDGVDLNNGVPNAIDPGTKIRHLNKMKEGQTAGSKQDGNKKVRPPRPPRPKLEKKESFSGEDIFLKDTFVDERGRRRGKRRNSLLVSSDDEEEVLLAPGVDVTPSPGEAVREFTFDREGVMVAPADTENDPKGEDLMDFNDDEEEGLLHRMSSVSSSEVEYGGEVLQRSESQMSGQSWASAFSSDSQLDEHSRQVKEFMKIFVDKIFQGEAISQTDKARFGELCQENPGRLWFARNMNAQRVNTKTVDEQIFYRLIQFFAICLFECNEAEDFSPAKTLMNMCFTFCHEVRHPSGPVYKHFLYSYLKDQPIWRSLRFWNAAFFDAVQHERSRRHIQNSGNDNEDRRDDRKFERNITFGQLGNFTSNMLALGLTKQLCLEFLKKQSTIASLKEEQQKMLEENIHNWKEQAVMK
ncbi:uncharacterized protein LOC106169538 [Lingula anatina]|uniref:Uncharacterized protein LOC106169538 n=1 Tax=Lingula anatina TaxID=7574 RepID=A0A1S3J2G7_LINAN|nr:uncharacterized protein LOC106169538 [Lingula anatina]XP_013404478.1 uncharacterized protein LOC106169538 [Lingula anatina]XP_013404479.1 uncharacterized protein LOC106169538 [Lingula anatina]XP_013404481.1 uncharacterized protein LOC106169538 [Lingula anatina]XP_013404482.1 uncharacterized protein LOC106169538 [Lingula anatina]|eukprot:XP_013404477.1 uncharacterized protein LOC106169538 [Lingula anatina]